MTPSEFKKYLARDFERCWHCGITGETLIPQHRANRGMGSVKSRNRPSNIIVLCSWFNQEIESNPEAAERARSKGWKLSVFDDPLFYPIWDSATQSWWFLDDEMGRAEMVL